ncbi:MAG: nucleotidyltransferase family protein, partial [Candidatus Dormibacteria bacterium]
MAGEPADAIHCRNGTASLGQLEKFRQLLGQSPLLLQLMHRAEQLRLPGWYIAAGCIAQTIWNVLGDRAPEQGISDYDLPFFDAADLSWT